MIHTIVSGGQTGVDRAALDAGLAAGLALGGWCPRGRRAEDGRIDAAYPLRETPTSWYAQRTAWNVRDADATLILIQGRRLTGGTALTARAAEAMQKPFYLADPTWDASLELVREWLRDQRVRTLNVAGPRDDSRSRIYSAAYEFLLPLFRVRVPYE